LPDHLPGPSPAPLPPLVGWGSLMPASGKRLCTEGCRKYKRGAHYNEGGRRCANCRQYKVHWRACSECGVAAPCTALPRDGSDSDSSGSTGESELAWACARCSRLTALRRGELPPQRGTKVSVADRDAFFEAQLDPATACYVRLWLVPRRRYCPLFWARLIFWLRWRCVAATLRGPPDGCVVRAGRNRRVMDTDALALHVRRLRDQGHWPPGNAPVLLTGVSDVILAQVKANLQLPLHSAGLPAWGAREIGRLRGCPDSLSELRTGPLDRAGFLQNPAGQSGNLLVRRCTDAMKRCFGTASSPAAAALPARFASTASLGEAGVLGNAARRRLLWT
jgi:hypothetical protein